MKKLSIFLIVCILLFVCLAACTPPDDGSGDQPKDVAVTEKDVLFDNLHFRYYFVTNVATGWGVPNGYYEVQRGSTDGWNSSDLTKPFDYLKNPYIYKELTISFKESFSLEKIAIRLNPMMLSTDTSEEKHILFMNLRISYHNGKKYGEDGYEIKEIYNQNLSMTPEEEGTYIEWCLMESIAIKKAKDEQTTSSGFLSIDFTPTDPDGNQISIEGKYAANENDLLSHYFSIEKIEIGGRKPI